MEALVEQLMEELNCETSLQSRYWEGFPYQKLLLYPGIIMAVLFLVCIILVRGV